MIVVADLGGSNTDLLLADDAGEVCATATVPALPLVDAPVLLRAAVQQLGDATLTPRLLVVTGGGHRRLPATVDGVPVARIDEIQAIAAGGLLAGGCSRALVVSMGTGTAMVVADADGYAHAGGVALGGGTVHGIARRLLGTTDPAQIAVLAEHGNIRGADLTIADLVGGGVGVLSGDLPAAYLARLGDPPTDADLAASVLDMIGHIVAHMALLTARASGLDTLVVIGHMVEFGVTRRAIQRFERALAGTLVIADQPGLAVARGALSIALRGEQHSPTPQPTAPPTAWTPQ